METKQIYKALAAINKGISAVGKDQTNTMQHYKFRGIDDVMNELHDLFVEHEVIIVQESVSYEIENRATKTNGINSIFRGQYKFTFFATDGSSVTATSFGEGQDTSDKASAKAISAALKGCLLQMFLIPTIDKQEAKQEEDSILPSILLECDNVKTMDGLTAIYKKYPAFWKTAQFINKLSECRKKLEK